MTKPQKTPEIFVEPVARAVCDAFWETAELPDRWSAMSNQKREVFRNCARAAIRVILERGGFE